ncbi:MAG: DUF1549 and DUF1553 domain-containing protein, partial [Planctomycetota bacterium]|nr:DUF1549 and DUF1553 domain-containing protein [Planctomycetota bacterium]
QSPAAYRSMVDRYLGSAAYGEHMARHWMDLARYADSNGYQYDTERQQWVWRDWVINAYNQNVPFDQFTIEQLAGDLLPNATPQQKLATGFNRNHGITIEGGVIDEEYRTEYVMDRLVTTGAVWMGLTIGCARCHEHKFDPISQREFYQLYAFFNQVPEKGMQGFSPQQTIASPLESHNQLRRESRLQDLRMQLNKPYDVTVGLKKWLQAMKASGLSGWKVLEPEKASLRSTGGSTLVLLDDQSVLAGGANPVHDIYEINGVVFNKKITAIRLEALMDPSLPGGGPGRHSNSNFVLSEIELKAVALDDVSQVKTVTFSSARSEYSQVNYEVEKAIDGRVEGSNGWAVDGPTRKKPVNAIFVAEEAFGFEKGTRLQFRLRHEAGFSTHGVGRVRLSITTDPSTQLKFRGLPSSLQKLVSVPWEQLSAEERFKLQAYFVANHDPRLILKQEINRLEKEQNQKFPPTMVMQDLPVMRKTFVLNRGDYADRGEEVTASVPKILPPMQEGAPLNRLGFAQWLTHKNHPLTARVAVNRYWQRVFGLGLVKTAEDFGIQGDLPSHPALLDWLAAEFIRRKWNVKAMQRLILNSATYRQTSRVPAALYQKDPENRWLSRGPRLRLEAEEIRDAALSFGGLLIERLGGRSVFPYQPKGLWLELNNRPGYSRNYPVGQGDELFRRSVYTFWKRTVPSPMLKTFDAPEREFCTIRRSRTNTPLQALLLMNGPQFVEAARGLGSRMMVEGGRKVEERLGYGFRVVTGRSASPAEAIVLLNAFRDHLIFYRMNPESVTQLLQVGASSPNQVLDRVELAAYTAIARMLMNLAEAITKG